MCNLPDVKVGDYVVVPTGVRDNIPYLKFDGVNRLSVARVEAVDEVVAIQPGDTIRYSWVVSVVDFSTYNATALRNRAIEEKLTKAYTQHIRKQYSDTVLQGLSEADQAELKSLL